jgi:hypothetical protein
MKPQRLAKSKTKFGAKIFDPGEEYSWGGISCFESQKRSRMLHFICLFFINIPQFPTFVVEMSSSLTYLFNGDVEDVIDIFGQPNPDEDDTEETIAVWKNKKWMFYYTGNEYDPWEMPRGGPHEFCVIGNVKDFEDKVKKTGKYVLMDKKRSSWTVKNLVTAE